ncbi:MAG: hypothetical protein ACTS9Y_00380 [Methylophilus sp.]|uniref:hypothetical protein n=1 Tax=Methylophilus sp. TaxID=29541 RepID=UPI003FA145A7
MAKHGLMGGLLKIVVSKTWWMVKFHGQVLKLIDATAKRNSMVGVGILSVMKLLFEQNANMLVGVCKAIERDSEVESRSVEDRFIYQIARAMVLIKAANDELSTGDVSQLEWSMNDCFDKIAIDSVKFKELLATAEGIKQCISRIKGIVSVGNGFAANNQLMDSVKF